jgi:hypothetical protein
LGVNFLLDKSLMIKMEAIIVGCGYMGSGLGFGAPWKAGGDLWCKSVTGF